MYKTKYDVQNHVWNGNNKFLVLKKDKRFKLLEICRRNTLHVLKYYKFKKIWNIIQIKNPDFFSVINDISKFHLNQLFVNAIFGLSNEPRAAVYY